MDGYTYEQYEAEQERIRRVTARQIWEEENADQLQDIKRYDEEVVSEDDYEEDIEHGNII